MSRDSAIAPGRYIHASAVLLGGSGVLIRGVSRAGKSSLADRLMDRVNRNGGFARLVGDDRIALERIGDHVVMRGHPAIAGLIERRGIGIEAVAFADQAMLALVVDLSMPVSPEPRGESAASVMILGVPVPRLALDRSVPQADQAAMILARLPK